MKILSMDHKRTLAAAAALCLLMLFTHQSFAGKVKTKSVNTSFQSWLKELKAEATQRGISDKTLKNAFKNVRLRRNLPDLQGAVKKKKKKSGKIRRQPEFASPGRYFPKHHLAGLSATSRKIYKKRKKALAVIERKYGVEAQIVLSVWGRETAFGRAKLPYYAIEVLTTQAYMGRRKAYFREELLLGLQILEKGHVKPGQMKSSWAGAMGYTQFMPGDFMKYAVDHDGDGRRDIWKNVNDALASTANYLGKNGWRKNMRWGHEVKLPKGMDCRLEGFDKGRTIAEWKKLGVSKIRGSFTGKDLAHRAYLLIPGGTRGPAFLVTDNFLVIKTYNQSNLYALFVGHLADRTSVERSFVGKWPGLKTFSRSHVRTVQKKMASLGYQIGKIDGIIGPTSRSIIGEFQNRNKLPLTCYPNKKFFALLNSQHKKRAIKQ